MASEQHIPIIYCRVIIATASSSHSDTQRMLAHTNINKQSLKQLDAGVSVSDYRQLLENAQVVSGKLTTLLDAGCRTPVSAHGPVGSAAAFAPDRLSILGLIRRFIRLRGSYNDVTITRAATETRVQISVDPVMGDQKDSALDLILGVTVNILTLSALDSLSIPTLRLMRIRRDDHDYYQRQLGCHILYEQPADSIAFSTEDLLQALPTYDPVQFNTAVRKCQMLYRRRQGAASTREAVEDVFEQSPGLLWPISSIADRLNMSARTLQRRLRAEGLQYQQVLDGWLMELALNYLRQEKLSVEATATLLGYQDEANFRRAYKRWYGCAPKTHLRRLASDRSQ